MIKHKYNTGELVELYSHRLVTIKRVHKGFTGWEYDLEVSVPDKNGYFETYADIPEGFIINKV